MNLECQGTPSRARALTARRKLGGRRAAAVDELVEIAECVGGPGLAGVCRLLAQDHSGWAGAHETHLLRQRTGALTARCTCLCCRRACRSRRSLVSACIGIG